MTLPIRPKGERKTRSPHANLFATGKLTHPPRCSVIVAHAADEIFGAGCLISKLMDVTILHATEGVGVELDPSGPRLLPNDISEQLHRECVAALALAHVPENKIVDFSLQQYALPQNLTFITRKIKSFLQESQPDIILTHPYEGGHPDHDAIAFATHAALRILNENGFKPPALFEMALYPSGEPIAKVPEFLSRMESESTTLLLDQQSQQLKQRMYNCLRTQLDLAVASPSNFERFRRPPDYDFTRLPHEGKLHYERFDWALSPGEWHALSTRALLQLFPETKHRQIGRNQAAA